MHRLPGQPPFQVATRPLQQYFFIRDAVVDDGERLARIYNGYISDSVVTFETEPVTDAEMSSRIAQCVADDLPWLVAESNKRLAGYAYASKWKGRCAYRFAVESTIYLAPECTGAGLGRTLYTALIERLREQELHTVIGGISLPNEASVRLHERLGFYKAGHFKEVGYKLDRWIDVGYWQLEL